MPYTPTNGAVEVVKQVGLSLASAGFPALSTAVVPAVPVQAQVDGWLSSAFKRFATTITPTPQTIGPSIGYGLITSSVYAFTPTCPRDMLLIMQLSGYATTVGAGIYPYKVTFDNGTTIYDIASGSFGIATANAHIAFPILQGIITADKFAYPLVPQTLRVRISTGGAGQDFNVDGNDIISYSVS